MIQPAFEILNQRGTPMFFSDVFANRPTAGIIGRIFISTDTKEFYRDTGTTWELIGGPGTGTITGSGAANQVAFWDSASSITGENNLWWDATNNYLGINTNTPSVPLDVHHSGNNGAILNQTTGTNNNLIAFQTSGNGRWRIGNFYNAGADDYGIFDVIGSIQPFTISKTTGQTFIGSKITASGRLVVNSASSDAHIQVVGANAPSVRIDNLGSGATQRFVMGLATATNNFIQGSTAGDICISTASASPLLFGMWQSINASEVMRITTSNNLLIGTTTDAGFKLYVSGTLGTTGNATIGTLAGSGTRMVVADANGLLSTQVIPSGTISGSGTTNYVPKFTGSSAIGNSNLQNDTSGNLGLGVSPSAWSTSFGIKVIDTGSKGSFYASDNDANVSFNQFFDGTNSVYKTTGTASRFGLVGNEFQWRQAPSGTAGNTITFTQAMTLDASGRLGIGTNSPSSYLTGNLAVSSSGDNYVSIVSPSTNAAGLMFQDITGTSIVGGMRYTHTDNVLSLWSAGAENLRISSGNVLIGTTSDNGDRFQVYGTGAYFKGSSTYNTISVDNNSSTGGGGIYFRQNSLIGGGIGSSGWWIGDTSNDLLLVSTASKSIRFYTNDVNAEKMRLDTSGNLGINVTNPSLFAAKLVVNSNISILNGSNLYLWSSGNGFAPSISAPGNSIAFKDNNGTEAMRISSSLNLLIGTTTDSGDKLRVSGTGFFSGTLTAATYLSLAEDGSYPGTYYTLGFSGITNGANRIFASRTGSDGIYIASATSRRIHFRPGGTATNLITITDDGNLLINTETNNGEKLQVLGTSRFTTFMGVGTAPDASTMLYVKGTATSTDFAAVFQNSAGTNLVRFFNNGKVNMSSLPTSSAGLSAGDIWNDAGTLKIV